MLQLKKEKVRYQHYIGNTAAIKTLFGQNRKDTNRKIILQGEVFGPLERSVIMDTFGKECMKKEMNLSMFIVLKSEQLEVLLSTLMYDMNIYHILPLSY